MLRLFVDENFNNDILRGLLRLQPLLDIVRVQDSNLSGRDDPSILDWAEEQGRVVVTHDVNTMPMHAFERVTAGKAMAGVIIVSPSAPYSVIIEDLLVMISASQPGELEGQVRYIPL